MGYDVALVEEYLRSQANIHSPLLSEKNWSLIFYVTHFPKEGLMFATMWVSLVTSVYWCSLPTSHLVFISSNSNMGHMGDTE